MKGKDKPMRMKLRMPLIVGLLILSFNRLAVGQTALSDAELQRQDATTKRRVIAV